MRRTTREWNHVDFNKATSFIDNISRVIVSFPKDSSVNVRSMFDSVGSGSYSLYEVTPIDPKEAQPEIIQPILETITPIIQPVITKPKLI